MPPAGTLVALVMLAVLALYARSPAAPTSARASGTCSPRDRARRSSATSSRAVGRSGGQPLWLIVVAVLLFVCFPLAFAAIATALHLPLLAMLLGVVLPRLGVRFPLPRSGPARAARWSVIFAVASVVTPVALGVCASAIASGAVRVDGGAACSAASSPAGCGRSRGRSASSR